MAKALGWNAPDGEGRKPGERTGLDTRVGSVAGFLKTFITFSCD